MSMFIVKRVVWIKLGQGRLPLLSFLVRDALRFYVVVFRESFCKPLTECKTDDSL